MISKYAIVLLISIVILSYLNIVRGFFQQDEWYAFGEMISHQSISYSKQVVSLFKLNSGHYIPIHGSVALLLFRLFRLQYHYWAIVSVSWHVLNVLLIYKLVKLLTKDKILYLSTAFLFGVSASIYQATTWIGANINTHGATSMGIASIYFFHKLLEGKSKTSDSRYLVLSIFFFILSLLFKEITLGLIPVYVVMLLLRKRENISALISYSIVGVSYLSMRAFALLLPTEGKEYVATNTQSLSQIVYNGLTFPFKVFSQTLVPQRYFIEFGYFLARLYPKTLRPAVATTEFDIFAQKIVLEGMSMLLFAVMAALIYKSYKKTKRYKNVFVFAGLFVVFNSIIYALSPERIGRISIMDSRNMYFPAIGVFLVIILMLRTFTKNNKLFLVVVGLFALVNFIGLETTLHEQVNDAEVRKNILKNIDSRELLTLDKVVVYTESSSSYFGLPEDEKILPFQSGFGQTFLVYFSDTLNLPSEFYTNYFLWELTSQEYKEVDGRGFGYFRDFGLLENAVYEYNIPTESIIAFSWNEELKVLNDITEETRNNLQ